MTFFRAISNWALRAGLVSSDVKKEFSKAVASGVVARSPIKTERYRDSHRVGLNEIDPSVAPPRKDLSAKAGTPYRGGPALKALIERIDSAGPDDVIFLSNNVEYAQRLEDGSSPQTNNQPDGIYGASYRQALANLPKIIGRVRKKRRL